MPPHLSFWNRNLLFSPTALGGKKLFAEFLSCLTHPDISWILPLQPYALSCTFLEIKCLPIPTKCQTLKEIYSINTSKSSINGDIFNISGPLFYNALNYLSAEVGFASQNKHPLLQVCASCTPDHMMIIMKLPSCHPGCLCKFVIKLYQDI